MEKEALMILIFFFFFLRVQALFWVLENEIIVSTQELPTYQKILRHLIGLDKRNIYFNNPGELLTSCALYVSKQHNSNHAY